MKSQIHAFGKTFVNRFHLTDFFFEHGDPSLSAFIIAEKPSDVNRFHPWNNLAHEDFLHIVAFLLEIWYNKNSILGKEAI